MTLAGTDGTIRLIVAYQASHAFVSAPNSDGGEVFIDSFEYAYYRAEDAIFKGIDSLR